MTQDEILKINERILMQLTKALRLLGEEGYNDKTLNPIRNMINEIREDMGVERVKTHCPNAEMVLYRPQPLERLPKSGTVVEVAEYLEQQIAFDLEAALVDGKIKPENYVVDNRKTIRQLIDKAITKFAALQSAVKLPSREELLLIIREVVKDYAGDGVLCDDEDGIEYVEEILSLLKGEKEK